jgi:hypothetical protein
MSTAVPVTEAWMTRKDLVGKGGGSDNAHTMLSGISKCVGWLSREVRRAALFFRRSPSLQVLQLFRSCFALL